MTSHRFPADQMYSQNNRTAWWSALKIIPTISVEISSLLVKIFTDTIFAYSVFLKQFIQSYVYIFHCFTSLFYMDSIIKKVKFNNSKYIHLYYFISIFLYRLYKYTSITINKVNLRKLLSACKTPSPAVRKRASEK